jgi:prepilin-type N-terminal cleavage/methylation domain-containing protein
MRTRSGIRGFTLVELSIVLVVVGLAIGGVLVGKDLIRAAEYRKFHSQIESYQLASNTFRVKYNAVPGDMPNATVLPQSKREFAFVGVSGNTLAEEDP